MGNHSIDCEFCGRDRRLVGPNCCDARTAHDAAFQAKIKSRDDANAEYLKRFGLEPRMDALGNFTKLDASDVVNVLRHLEEKRLLISRRGVSPKPRRSPRV